MSGPPSDFRFEHLPNGWTVGVFSALEAMGSIAHAVTTRRGPAFAPEPEANAGAVRELAAALGLEDAAFCRQVHGAEVLRADRGGLGGEGDAVLTDRAGLGVLAFSADCPLILLADGSGRAVGAVHASWRGTVRRAASRAVAALAETFSVRPADLVACVCPSAGPCCYRVGPEVLDAARAGLGPSAGRFFLRRGDGLYFDLWAANRDDLLRAGLRPEGIRQAGVCTVCRNDLFPSYRVEKDLAERFAAVIGLTGRKGVRESRESHEQEGLGRRAGICPRRIAHRVSRIE